MWDLKKLIPKNRRRVCSCGHKLGTQLGSASRVVTGCIDRFDRTQRPVLSQTKKAIDLEHRLDVTSITYRPTQGVERVSRFA